MAHLYLFAHIIFIARYPTLYPLSTRCLSHFEKNPGRENAKVEFNSGLCRAYGDFELACKNVWGVELKIVKSTYVVFIAYQI